MTIFAEVSENEFVRVKHPLSKVKVKVNVVCIAPRRDHCTSKALRYGTRCQGISQSKAILINTVL